MGRRVSRGLVVTGLILASSYLFAGGNMTCGSVSAEAAISSVDMCFVFDCTNGAFGGLLDPCGTIVGSDITGGGATGGGGGGTGGSYEGPRTGALFADCPATDVVGGN